MTVQCVQLSSSSQSGFLPCYHLKMKGMHPYVFCPGRSCSIPTRIRVQALASVITWKWARKDPNYNQIGFAVSAPVLKRKGVLIDALRSPFTTGKSPFLQQPGGSPRVWLASLQEEILYGHAEASMYSLFGAATLKYSGFSAAGTFKRPLGLVSFGKKSCW